jgi:hypothetical protein
MIESRVTDLHPQYVQHQDQWQRVADCLGGLDAVRTNVGGYLPIKAPCGSPALMAGPRPNAEAGRT